MFYVATPRKRYQHCLLKKFDSWLTTQSCVRVTNLFSNPSVCHLCFSDDFLNTNHSLAHFAYKSKKILGSMLINSQCGEKKFLCNFFVLPFSIVASHCLTLESLVMSKGHFHTISYLIRLLSLPACDKMQSVLQNKTRNYPSSSSLL